MFETTNQIYKWTMASEKTTLELPDRKKSTD